MKTLKALVLEIFSALMLLPALAGATPNQINYQGRLVDAAGNPISGSTTLIFRIFDAPTSGSPVWTETQTLSLDNGIFNASLGSQTNLPPSVFSSDTRYLEVQISGDAAPMSPRTQLLSVPYAIYAASAASVGVAGQSVTISTHVTVLGNVTASKYYGDGSALTGISLGGSSIILPIVSTHIATGGITTGNIAALAITDAKINDVSVSKLTGNLPSTQIAAGDLPANVNATAIKTGNYLNDVKVSSAIYAGSAASAAAYSGNINTTQIAAGDLLNTVIASSVAVDGIYANAIQANAVTDAKIATGITSSKLTGALPAISGASLTSLTAANIAAGSLGAGVIASSIAVNAVQDASIVGVSGSKVSGGIPAASIASGSLGAGVIASSVAVDGIYTNAIQANAVTDAKIATGITSSKLTGALPAISGASLTSLTAANIAAGSLLNTVIASSVAVDGIYTNAIQANAVTDAKIATGITPSKITGTAAVLGANVFTGVQTYGSGASITAAANINEVQIATSVYITQGGITASSGTFTAVGLNQYSIATSSGINVAAGTVNVADTVVAAKAVATNTTSSRFHIPALTTANIQTIAPVEVGDLYFNTTLKAVCVSTGTATFAIVQSSSPATACQ